MTSSCLHLEINLMYMNLLFKSIFRGSKFLTLFFLVLINNFDAICQNIDSLSMHYITNAEIGIMENKFHNAVKDYNISFSYKRPSNLSINNYFTILDKDSILRKLYIDTIKYFVLKYNISVNKNILNRFEINNSKYSKTKFKNKSDKHRDCSKLDSIFIELGNNDRNIRNNVLSQGITQGEMYNKEPFKTKIKSVDSAIQTTIYGILLDSNNNHCIYNLLNQRTVIRHMFQFRLVDSIELDKLLIEKAFKGFLDKSIVAEILMKDYNQSKYYKHKSEYEFDRNILVTNTYIFFPILTTEELKQLEIARSRFNLEPYSHYCRKLIWQIENRGSGFILTTFDAPFYGFNVEQENKIMQTIILKSKNLDINKMTNYKFKERITNFFQK